MTDENLHKFVDELVVASTELQEVVTKSSENLTNDAEPDGCEEMKIVEDALRTLLGEIGGWEIVPSKLVPHGLGKAAKGRTVWRVVEEVLKQNLQKDATRLGLHSVDLPDDEVGPFDCIVHLNGEMRSVHVNLKAATVGGRANKDDVSKAEAIEKFYNGNPEAILCVAVNMLAFEGTMLRLQDGTELLCCQGVCSKDAVDAVGDVAL